MKKELIKFYLDWKNNYPSTKAMADHYGLTKAECQDLIEIGRKYHNEEAMKENSIILIAKEDSFMNNGTGRQFLTKGKEYTVISTNGEEIKIIDDGDEPHYFSNYNDWFTLKPQTP